MGRNMESKRRRNVHARILEQSGWQCEMPECIADTRNIDPALQGEDDPWGPSVDHIRPLAAGGRDIPSNMRAAHKACNNYAGKGQMTRQVIGELYPDLLFLAREIARSD